jgi:Peptidase M50B-like
MPVNYQIAENARPQISLLLIATAVSVGIWIVSWFVPVAAYVVYPLQLFATFIHESSHALAALITGNAVMSLTVSPDASGAVWSQVSGVSALFISSAGYLGTTAFGTALLAWMRYGWSSRIALYASAGLIAVMTVAFGFLAPFWNLLANVTFLSVVFTVFSGAVLAVGRISCRSVSAQRILQPQRPVLHLRRRFTTNRRRQHGDGYGHPVSGLGRALDHHLADHDLSRH